VEIWAHRGRSQPTDFGNTLSDFKMAQCLGVTGIETDISFSLDKEVIIYHPGTTEQDYTKLTWKEIQATGFPIVRLSDLFVFLKNNPRLQCCLDIKENSKELVRKVVVAIIGADLEERVHLTAFQKRIPRLKMESDVSLLIYAKWICPGIKTHIITPWPINLVGIAERYRPDAISFGWLQEPWWLRLIGQPFFKGISLAVNLKKQVREARKIRKGMKIWAGVVNEPKDMLYFIGLGIDGIVTDNPRLLKALLDKKEISV